MTGRRSVLIWGLAIFLTACGGSTTPGQTPTPNPNPAEPTPDPAEPSPDPTPVANNAAIITGDALGSGTTPKGELQRAISASLTNENAAFELGEAYATRSGSDDEILEWFVAVTNRSGSLHCAIEATSVNLLDAAGQVLDTSLSFYVQGSVGKATSPYTGDFYTNDCLASGETGYFSGVVTESFFARPYTSVEALSVETIESNADSEGAVARVLPQSVTVTDQPALSGDEISVTVKNEGPGSVRLTESSPFFLLDEANRPLWRNGFIGDGQILAAGDTTVLTGYLAYDGLASRVLVQIGFEDVPAAAGAR